MLKKYDYLFVLTICLVDAAIVLLSLYAGFYLRFFSGLFTISDIHQFKVYFKLLWIIIPFWIIIMGVLKNYQIPGSIGLLEEIKRLTTSVILGILILLSFTFLIDKFLYSRIVLTLFGTIVFTVTLVSRLTLRFIFHYLTENDIYVKKVLIAGTGSLGPKIEQNLLQHKLYGWRIIGYLAESENSESRFTSDITKLGTFDTLIRVCKQHEVDLVIIALPLRSMKTIIKLMNLCEDNGIKIKVAPDFFGEINSRPVIDTIADIPLIGLRDVPLDHWYAGFLKRIFDIVFSVVIMTITFPLMFITTCLIKLTSQGPIIFKQKRLGIDNRPFTIYKFRTMVQTPQAESDSTWSKENDSRISGIGAYLRKLNLDELPQFFNVLNGDMSIVGPRPERPYFAEKFKEKIPKYLVRHQIKTGITGWAQIHGLRGDTSIEKRLDYDMYYMENWSLLFDMEIILKTIVCLITQRQVYYAEKTSHN